MVVAVSVAALVSQALLFRSGGDAGFGARLIVVLAFGVLGGLTAMGTAYWMAGDYGAGFWTAVGLVVLAALAVGAVVAGLARLLGAPGIALAALVVVLLSLVSSGGPVGSQLLPSSRIAKTVCGSARLKAWALKRSMARSAEREAAAAGSRPVPGRTRPTPGTTGPTRHRQSGCTAICRRRCARQRVSPTTAAGCRRRS